MRLRSRLLIAFDIVVCLLLFGCGEGSDSTVPETTSADLVTSVPATSTITTEGNPLVGIGEVELIDESYSFTEGPQWIADDGVLLFTDYPGGGSRINQLGADGEVTVFRQIRGATPNGLAVDPQGRLIAAEGGARQVTRTESDGTITVLAKTFEGVRLNQPNDIAVRSDGTIYFTDPLFQGWPTELNFMGVFRIAPDGELTAERRGHNSEAPNGIVLSPDETRLYVANYARGLVWVFDVAVDGSLSEAQTFVTTTSGSDGMAVDVDGNLFVSTNLGIEVFAPDGTKWGMIEVPRTPANCAFGGADGRTLYITAREGLYKVTLAHPGVY